MPTNTQVVPVDPAPLSIRILASLITAVAIGIIAYLLPSNLAISFCVGGGTALMCHLLDSDPLNPLIANSIARAFQVRDLTLD